MRNVFCSPSRFFFGIKRDAATFSDAGLPPRSTHLIRLTVRNLNKQSKLFSQGMSPIVMTLPLSSSSSPLQPPLSCVQRWERLRERSTYGSCDGGFDVSFRVRVEARSVTYVAFTYPYTYRELQNYLARLERKFAGPKAASAADYEDLQDRDPDRFSLKTEYYLYRLYRY